VKSIVAARHWLICAAAALGMTLVTTSASADPSTTSPEQGFDSGDALHPRILAMGSAHYALGSSTSALYGNPANLVFSRLYHFEGTAALSPEARRQSYGGAVADSSASKVAGAVGGSYSMQDPDGIKRSWTDLRLALALPLSDKVAVGLVGRYLRLDQSPSRGPLGRSLASDGALSGQLFAALTFDLGIAVQPKKGIRLGLVGRNLTVPDSAFAPTQLVAAVGYLEEKFGVEADALVDFHTYGRATVRAMAGGEYLAGEKFPLRVGYRYDQGGKIHSLCLGAGYVDKRFSVDVGFRRDVGAEHPATFVGVGLRVFVDRAGSQNASDSGDGSAQGNDGAPLTSPTPADAPGPAPGPAPAPGP
jgi:hypothetical protein